DKHNIEYHFQIAENRMYHSKLHDSKIAHNLLIENMTITLRDFGIETKEHIERVKDLSLLIVEHLDLDDSEIEKLKEFINYHDVGKIATAFDIVKCKNSNEEITLDKKIKHSEIGYQIAKSSSELINISYLILTHHESWDGTGYPLGLSGRGIPYLSRIFRVAHDFDTLLYGGYTYEPHTIDEVVEFFVNNSGKVYDPDFTKILVERIIPDKFSQKDFS
ncbi:MAG: HD domain-containing protein, partial [Firmicutes bacterium]|nr:HD domain-containing protein [Bacillota bacterium]